MKTPALLIWMVALTDALSSTAWSQEVCGYCIAIENLAIAVTKQIEEGIVGFSIASPKVSSSQFALSDGFYDLESGGGKDRTLTSLPGTFVAGKFLVTAVEDTALIQHLGKRHVCEGPILRVPQYAFANRKVGGEPMSFAHLRTHGLPVPKQQQIGVCDGPLVDVDTYRKVAAAAVFADELKRVAVLVNENLVKAQIQSSLAPVFRSQREEFSAEVKLLVLEELKPMLIRNGKDDSSQQTKPCVIEIDGKKVDCQVPAGRQTVPHSSARRAYAPPAGCSVANRRRFDRVRSASHGSPPPTRQPPSPPRSGRAGC